PHNPAASCKCDMRTANTSLKDAVVASKGFDVWGAIPPGWLQKDVRAVHGAHRTRAPSHRQLLARCLAPFACGHPPGPSGFATPPGPAKASGRTKTSACRPGRL